MSDYAGIVCLANSVKLKHFCFAGVRVETYEWIRPIGAGPNGAVLREEQELDDGGIAALLDVVEVPLADPIPEPGQPENWSIADGRWIRTGSLEPADALTLLENLVTDESLFGNRGKAVPASVVEEKGVPASLTVVRPREITWRKGADGRVSAIFEHADRELDLKVTDPEWTPQFSDDEPGDYVIEGGAPTFLTVSLADEWEGWHTKLVAGVIQL